MRKLLIILIIGCLFLGGINCPANAGFLSAQKLKIEKNKKLNIQAEEISNFFDKQTNFSNKHNYDKLYKMYSPNYINGDGFNKEIYFKLVKDTWDSYSDVAYASKIRSIDVKDTYATVEVLEVAVATTPGLDDVIDSPGELTSLSKCTYYLEKLGDEWFITSEYVSDERTFLKFGEARFIDINLTAPSIVYAGKEYTSNLTVDLPKDTVVIASIGKERIIYPENKSEDVFRKLPETDVLERVFTANRDNVNEYSVASVGITRAKATSDESVKVYMSGLAFLMTRINVIPENKFIKNEVSDDKKAK